MPSLIVGVKQGKVQSQTKQIGPLPAMCLTLQPFEGHHHQILCLSQRHRNA